MEWLDKIKQYAPDIALAIATGGTSAAASIARRILAKELTGDERAPLVQVQAAAERAEPADLAELTRANNDYLLERQRLDNQRVQTVNETMRVESQSEHTLAAVWRPIWGIISAIAFGIVAIAIAITIAVLAYHQPATIIGQLPAIVGSLAALFSIPGAILGVSAWHRGKEKRIRAGEIPLESVLSKLAGSAE